MDSTHWRRLILLGGLSLILTGSLLQLQFNAEEADAAAATVHLIIRGPQDRLLLDDVVDVAAPAANVLGVLTKASEEHGFWLETRDYPSLGTMVVRIYDFQNGSTCAWLYSVDDVDGDVAADKRRVQDGQVVLWKWSCWG